MTTDSLFSTLVSLNPDPKNAGAREGAWFGPHKFPEAQGTSIFTYRVIPCKERMKKGPWRGDAERAQKKSLLPVGKQRTKGPRSTQVASWGDFRENVLESFALG
jgi:hypothetical protein